MSKLSPALLSIIVLGACAPAPMDSGTELFAYPQESWTCQHLESQFSAHVEAETVDEEQWTRIEFFIHDYDSSYELEMQLDKDGVWRTSANLYDLDCNSDHLGALFTYYEL